MSHAPDSPPEVARLLDAGVQMASRGRLPEAIGYWQAVVSLAPDHVAAHHNLGAAFGQLRQFDLAQHHLRRALELEPDYPEACFNLANIVWKSTADPVARQAETTALLERAIRIRPAFLEAQYKLGSVLIECGRQEEAIAVLSQAIDSISSQPAHPLTASILNQLGVAFSTVFRYDEAHAAFDSALRLRSNYAEAYSNLGNSLQEQGRLPEAIGCYEQSIALNPNAPTTRFNLALARLQSGDFERGWPEYDWRLYLQHTPRRFQSPHWDGQDLAGKTILIHLEQGMGDAIQFIRFLPLVQSTGGRVIVECPAYLEPLFARCRGIDELILEGAELPAFDVQAPLLSLPRLLGIRLQNLPGTVPYLFIDQEVTSSWRERLEKIEGFKIGIVWEGDSRFAKNRIRSVPLEYFLRLAEIPGVKLVSLQKGPSANQLSTLSAASVMELMASREVGPGTLLETAGLIQALDLVVTIDSGIAHLAGALARPVWLALSSIGEWRWLVDREDSPWYPTMRLFRQKKPGVWSDVFHAMEVELRKQIEGVQ